MKEDCGSIKALRVGVVKPIVYSLVKATISLDAPCPIETQRIDERFQYSESNSPFLGGQFVTDRAEEIGPVLSSRLFGILKERSRSSSCWAEPSSPRHQDLARRARLARAAGGKRALKGDLRSLICSLGARSLAHLDRYGVM